MQENFYSEHLKVLIGYLGKLPGLGPRSGQRIALYLLKHTQKCMNPMIQALQHVKEHVTSCQICGYLDERNPCGFCTSDQRNSKFLCVVSDVSDVWALERAGFFKGKYHVLGGTLSALDGMNPEDLSVEKLIQRCKHNVKEILIALNMSIEGQATLHYVAEQLRYCYPDLAISTLARGIPLGGELSYLDDGTLLSAFSGRQAWS
jgi:recombination protein RecR